MGLNLQRLKAWSKTFRNNLKNLCCSFWFLEELWGRDVPLSVWQWFNIEEFILMFPHICMPERHVGNISTKAFHKPNCYFKHLITFLRTWKYDHLLSYLNKTLRQNHKQGVRKCLLANILALFLCGKHLFVCS